MKILHVVGARPNFPKLAPVYRAARARGLEQLVVHTGQHYDDSMSADFFRDLGLPAPDINLAVGSGSHAVQTARIMERMEPVLLERTGPYAPTLRLVEAYEAGRWDDVFAEAAQMVDPDFYNARTTPTGSWFTGT